MVTVGLTLILTCIGCVFGIALHADGHERSGKILFFSSLITGCTIAGLLMATQTGHHIEYMLRMEFAHLKDDRNLCGHDRACYQKLRDNEKHTKGNGGHHVPTH